MGTDSSKIVSKVVDSLSSDSILIAATNHHELLDPVIWKRFTRVITLEKPQKDDIGSLLKNYLTAYGNNILKNEKKMELLEKALLGFSHADIKTTIGNVMKEVIIKPGTSISNCDILCEIYFNQHHSIDDVEEFLGF